MAKSPQHQFREFLDQYNWVEMSSLLIETGSGKQWTIRFLNVQGHIVIQVDYGDPGHQIYLPTPNDRDATRALIERLVKRGRIDAS